MLTLEMLEKMEPETLFADGRDPQLGVWVAVRGGIADWAVYASHDRVYATLDGVAQHGDKVWKNRAIQLVGADEEAALRYRP